MKFVTQFDARDRSFAPVGSGVKVMYSGRYDDRGHVVLDESGKINLYQEIQSHADSCDIHVIMDRYVSGDVGALSRVQGAFLDVTNMPKTYAEYLNTMNSLERSFLALDPDVRSRFGNSFAQFLASVGDADFFERLGHQAPEPVEENFSKEEASE